MASTKAGAGDGNAALIAALTQQIDQPPGEADHRNINQDVHSGGHPQRPYARLEDDLARARGGQFVRFEDLPKEAGAKMDPQTLDWYREIKVHTGEQRLVDGVLHNVVRIVRRPIAQTLAEAKAAGADFWAGTTWIRRGVKPEAEHAVNRGAGVGDGEEYLEPVSATEQIQARQDALTRLAGTPIVPSADPGMPVGRAAGDAAQAKADAKAADDAKAAAKKADDAPATQTLNLSSAPAIVPSVGTEGTVS